MKINLRCDRWVLEDGDKNVVFSPVIFQEASNDRKLQMQALDRARQKNEKLNDLDEEARQKAEYLLQKAKEQQEEQEDEIKHLNEVRREQDMNWALKMFFMQVPPPPPPPS